MRHRKRKDGRGGTKRREFEECRAESQVCARIRENRDGRRWREIRNPPVRRPSSTRINFGGERVIKAVAGRGKKFTSPLPRPRSSTRAREFRTSDTLRKTVYVLVRTCCARWPVGMCPWHTRRPNDVTVMVHLRDACHRTGCLFRIN